MTLKYPKPGVNDIGSYQISGIPYVTASLLQRNETLQINFPFVTKNFTVFNNGSSTTEVAVGFSASGTLSGSQGIVGGAKSGNYFIVKGGTNFTAEVRCTTIFLSNSVGETQTITGGHLGTQAGGTLRVNVLGSLTRIDSGEFPTLTGSINSTSSFEGIG